MTAALTRPPLALSLRERMAQLLSATASGLVRPEPCEACLAVRGQCPACRQAQHDVATLNEAVTAVLTAPTEAKAICAYTGCVLTLPGLDDGTSL